MNTPFFKLTAFTAGAALLLFSCTKEAPMKTYPNEMTLDNWEEFVDAPQALLDEHAEKKRQQATSAVVSDKPSSIVEGQKCVIFGNVTRWNGSSWMGLGGVSITQGTQSATTNSGALLGRYALCNNNSSICMAYTADSDDGVDVGDVITIRRHILDIERFETNNVSEEAARRYVAADANEDGQITEADIDLIIDIILNVDTFDENFDFVADARLNMLFVNAGFLSWMHGQCDSPNFPDRRIIKKGDVDNTFAY